MPSGRPQPRRAAPPAPPGRRGPPPAQARDPCHGAARDPDPRRARAGPPARPRGPRRRLTGTVPPSALGGERALIQEPSVRFDDCRSAAPTAFVLSGLRDVVEARHVGEVREALAIVAERVGAGL